ncbi:Uncharacterized protein APZ42_014708 [Daphnia magna]|uniref:Uncharacterized protein n=1 Tax=Daphnia magna TaxID=35525 RepID=A0A162PNF4_9CRUS|nr:Uncharacterized protein APZ42_014708 [Daphnia magna]
MVLVNLDRSNAQCHCVCMCVCVCVCCASITGETIKRDGKLDRVRVSVWRRKTGGFFVVISEVT